MTDSVDRAREAFGRRAWRRSYEDYATADEALGTDDLERLAIAAHLIGADDWTDRWSAACRSHEARGEAARAARCAFWLAYGLLATGRVALGGGWLGRAHELVDAAGTTCAERGLLLIPEAIECCDERPADALERFTDASVIGRRRSDPDLLAVALMGQGQAQLRLGAIGRALDALDAAMLVVVSEQLCPIAEGIVYCGVIDACQEMLELRRAEEWTAALSRWCDDQPDLVPFRGECLVHRSEVMRVRGEWHEALEEARRARRQLEGTPAAGEAAYREGDLHRLMGSFADAEACFRAAGEAGRDPQPGLSLLRLATGDVDVAVTGIVRARAEPATGATRLLVLAAAVEIHLVVDDVPAATEAVAELDAVARTLRSPFAHAIALHAAGTVHLAADDLTNALAALRGAWHRWQELSAPYEAARTRAVLGLACRASGDDEAAAMELDAARLTFTRLGAVTDLAAVERALARRGDAPPGGLSGREMEVLALVAAGHTNREIASSLFLSEHTVARHIQNIFAKLGVTTRTAAAAIAHRHGLV